jgi:hypothetical protein
LAGFQSNGKIPNLSSFSGIPKGKPARPCGLAALREIFFHAKAQRFLRKERKGENLSSFSGIPMGKFQWGNSKFQSNGKIPNLSSPGGIPKGKPARPCGLAALREIFFHAKALRVYAKNAKGKTCPALAGFQWENSNREIPNSNRKIPNLSSPGGIPKEKSQRGNSKSQNLSH